MQRLEVSGAVRLIYRSLGVKGLIIVGAKNVWSKFVSVNKIFYDISRLNTALKGFRSDRRRIWYAVSSYPFVLTIVLTTSENNRGILLSTVL